MPINPYLNFAGNCREAVEYYAEVFQTEKPQIMTFGEMPPDPSHPLPEAAKNLVVHAGWSSAAPMSCSRMCFLGWN